jgi:hypothetical protein
VSGREVIAGDDPNLLDSHNNESKFESQLREMHIRCITCFKYDYFKRKKYIKKEIKVKTYFGLSHYLILTVRVGH